MRQIILVTINNIQIPYAEAAKDLGMKSDAKLSCRRKKMNLTVNLTWTKFHSRQHTIPVQTNSQADMDRWHPAVVFWQEE